MGLRARRAPYALLVSVAVLMTGTTGSKTQVDTHRSVSSTVSVAPAWLQPIPLLSLSGSSDRSLVILSSRHEQMWLALPSTRCIARAESGDPAHPEGDYTRGGMEPYGGKWQFSVTTFQGLGFSGLPNAAPPVEQDHAAYVDFTLNGASQWQTAAGCGV